MQERCVSSDHGLRFPGVELVGMTHERERFTRRITLTFDLVGMTTQAFYNSISPNKVMSKVLLKEGYDFLRL
jgi:hypothetical protein